MKKNLLLSLAALGLFALSANTMAQNQANNNTVTIMSVNQLGNIEEDTTVTLQGNITKNLGNETYIFTDSTGNINVVIEDDEWNGVTFNPNTLVIISGEIDKEGDLTEIDVEEIQTVQ